MSLFAVAILGSVAPDLPFTGDRDLEAEGRAERAGGHVREQLGKAREKAGEAVEDLGDKIKGE